jgi:hypothetical protein
LPDKSFVYRDARDTAGDAPSGEGVEFVYKIVAIVFSNKGGDIIKFRVDGCPVDDELRFDAMLDLIAESEVVA